MTAVVPRPLAMVAAASCPASTRRQASTTWAPCLTSCRAVSSPMPELAPVTMQVRPERSFSKSFGSQRSVRYMMTQREVWSSRRTLPSRRTRRGGPRRESQGIQCSRSGSKVMREEGMASLFDGTEGMEDIAEILGRMKANVPHPASTSSKLWTLRRATRIASHHRGRETLLEKAVAMLAANGHMPGWFNQCPAASGIGDSSRNRRSNIDLVHWSEADGHARLVELKWNSDDPSEALRQILRYGAAYLFCRAYSDRLPVRRRRGAGSPRDFAPGRRAGPLLHGIAVAGWTPAST